MLKEFLPAIEWLERRYDDRDQIDGAWRIKIDPAPPGQHIYAEVSPNLDLNTYRRGPYQILDGGNCGEYLRDLCEEGGGECDHPDHDDYVDCYCFGGTPQYILGMPWTEEDERRYLKSGNYRGDSRDYTAYLQMHHPWIWTEGFDDKPNDIDWWREDNAAA